jgi:molybdate transport system substrate-binding protein
MRAFGRAALIAAGLLSSTGMARADEVRVLCMGAVEVAVRNLAADFARDSGHQVQFTFASPAAVMQKIQANEVHDAVIVSELAMDRLDKEGVVNPESRVRLALVGIGVVTRAGNPIPDVSTPEAFKQTLLAAKSLVHTEPQPYFSGERVQRILAKAGILDAIKPKIVVVSGLPAVQETVAKGEAELGFLDLSEIPEDKGLKPVGAVPAPLQINATFEAALMSDGSAVEATRDFVRFLASAEARPKWIAARLTPLGDR